MKETLLSCSASSPLSFILHAVAPSTHPALHPSPVLMTIFSSSAAILEFVADWLLLGVWAAISSGMSGLLSNHSRFPVQGGQFEALIATLSLL